MIYQLCHFQGMFSDDKCICSVSNLNHDVFCLLCHSEVRIISIISYQFLIIDILDLQGFVFEKQFGTETYFISSKIKQLSVHFSFYKDSLKVVMPKERFFSKFELKSNQLKNCIFQAFYQSGIYSVQYLLSIPH